jgi:RimK family alpha-L-glutamate ligase
MSVSPAKVAIVADRLGWEERRLIEAAPEHGLVMEWANDESLTLGAPEPASLDGYQAVLVRSRSYTRGGLVAGLAEAAGQLTVNTAQAIHACENKAALRGMLRSSGVRVPDFRLALSRKDFDHALADLGTPAVLKPVFGGMGKRVTLLRDSDTAASVYDYVEDLGHAFEQACLIEPYLGGTSVRCMVVGRELVGAARFSSGGTDWRNNAALGNSSLAVHDDPGVQKTVQAVVDVLGEGIYGVDLFTGPDGGYLVNEVNHAPGFRAVATATGADAPAAICRYLLALLKGRQG